MRTPPMMLALALAGCAGERSEPQAPPPEAPSAPTPWVPAREPADVSLFEAPARVLAAPGATGVVVPPVPARVVGVRVQVGERVAEDGAVAEVVMPELVAAAAAEVGAAERVEAWQRRRKQLEELRREGLARLTEELEARTSLAEARAEERAAAATLRAAGIGPEEAKRLVSGDGRTVLRSPVAGVVVELDAALGATRAPQDGPIARIVGEGEPRIEARFGEALPAGAEYVFVSGSLEVPVTLANVAAVSDDPGGTWRAWFRAPGDAGLVPGMAGRVAARFGAHAGLVAVPARAVLTENGRTFVFRRANGGVERVPVKVLASSGTDALVRGTEAALAPGEDVAAEASALAATGGGA